MCFVHCTDLCLLDTCLTKLMGCGCLAFTWAQSILSLFNCCKHPPFKIKKVQQLVYFVAATLSGTCIDFPQEYFVVIAVIAIFYIVQRKLFDKWFTT